MGSTIIPQTFLSIKIITALPPNVLAISFANTSDAINLSSPPELFSITSARPFAKSLSDS